MSELKSLRQGARNIIRVSVPGEVLFNLDKMQKVTASILGRAGCPGCTSGLDIRYVLTESEFAVNRELNVREAPAGEV